MQWKSLRRSQRIQPKGNRLARRIVAARNDHSASFKAAQLDDVEAPLHVHLEA
jgi:hypothetical protein